ncbi:glycosyltransferase family 2 protein [Rarobacter incanus]|uniref:Glycosyl transferase family 2 n=1 Tax=Rarobacter incanus TaxID=153494 RepID=A0A542SNN5_9MICO|nr:glycosyltransferase [Rarobacter incanus]TQK76241.1 glycosyl transferase family 2 [Rarobacter incanus]
MSAPARPRAQIVIAVHTPARPLRRAVSSVLAGGGPIGVIVVAHGIDPDALSPHLAGLDPSRIEVIRHVDGIASAAGPFNAGIAHARAEWVAVMGSDDMVEAGCYEALLRHGDGAPKPPDAILAPIRHQDGTEIPNPLPRPGRTDGLDAVRDRVLYRTSPLGLLRRTLWQSAYRFDESLHAGIDMEPSARLWASGAQIAYPRGAPRYIIGADAASRVSMDPVPVERVMRAVLSTATAPWTRSAPAAVRRSLAVKLARIHVLGFVVARILGQGAGQIAFSDEDIAALRAAMRAICALSDRWAQPFSRADLWVLRELLNPRATASTIGHAVNRRAAANMWNRHVPPNPAHVLDRESNPVRVILTALDRKAISA